MADATLNRIRTIATTGRDPVQDLRNLEKDAFKGINRTGGSLPPPTRVSGGGGGGGSGRAEREAARREAARQRAIASTERRRIAVERARQAREDQARREAARKEVVRQNLIFKETERQRARRNSQIPVSAGISRARQKVNRARGRIRTRQLRGKGRITDVPKQVGLAAADFGVGVLELGEGLVKDPKKTLKATGKGLKDTGERFISGEGFPEVTRIAREEPAFGAGAIATEVIITKGAGKAVSAASKGVELGSAVVDPRFVRVTKTGKGAGTIKNVRGVGDIDLFGKGEGFGFTKAEQASLIGKKGTVITTAKGLTKRFKRKFEIASKEKGINIKGQETDFGLFATPFNPRTGRATTRVSRIGADTESASLRDLLSGEEISLTKSKPEFVAFPEQTIGKEFKPFGKATSKGSPTTELEVTLEPGKVVRATETPAVTIVEGRKVPIRIAEVVKGTKGQQQAFKKLQEGKKLTPVDKLNLRKLGLDSSSGRAPSKVIQERPFLRGGSDESNIDIESEISGRSGGRPSTISFAPRITRRPTGSGGSTPPRVDNSFEPPRSPTPRSPTPRSPTGRRRPTFIWEEGSRNRFEPPILRPRTTGSRVTKGRKVKVKRKRRFDDPLIFTPDFTAKTLGIRKRFTTKEIRRIARGSSGVGVREVPSFIE